MSHFVRLKASSLGRWAELEVPTATQWTLLDQQLQKAINGDGGGSYSPSSLITIGGESIVLASYFTRSSAAGLTRYIHASGGYGDSAMPQLYAYGSATNGGCWWTGTARASRRLTVEITTTGNIAGGLARFRWQEGSTWTSNVTVAATVSIGGGTTLNFDDFGGTFAVGETWYADPIHNYSVTTAGGIAGDVKEVVGMMRGAEYRVPLNRVLRDGATLDSVTLNFRVTSSHANVPAFLPQMFIERLDNIPGPGSPNGSNLVIHSGSPYYVAAPGSGAAWYAAGAFQSVTRNMSGYNVIDKSLYSYEMVFIDESGSNSFTYPPIPTNDNDPLGTALSTIQVVMSNVVDARPG